MEKRTIGGFIAALRRANGMTQKDLAEKLNVSDKTVSRWECDDGTPDLSVIPVIAEVFGVSCDELLRGERKPVSERTVTSEETESTAKGEKQRQRILTVSLSKYKTCSFIAMGIAIAGVIAAMIGNFGFLRAYIGFLVGTVFYLASVICQAVFVNNAFLSVSDDSLSGAQIGQFRKSVIRLAEYSIGLTHVLLAFSLPLMIFVFDAYAGLSAASWFMNGTGYGIIALLIYCVACYFINAVLVKKGIYYLHEREEEVYKYNHNLKRKCSLTLAVIMVGTFIVHLFVVSRWDSVALSDGIEFHDYESFVAFMEQDIPYTYSDKYSSSVPVREEPVDDITYYDQYEEALRRTLRISDGTEEGKIVCEYMERNQTVCSIRYTEKDGSLLPITVITYDDVRRGQAKQNIIHTLFVVLYCFEIVGAFAVYFHKREKLS